MIKNILKSLACHIAIGVLFIPIVMIFLLFGLDDSGGPKEYLLGCTYIIISFILYFFAGKRILEPAQSKVKNFVSVWLLGLALLLIAIIFTIYQDSYSNTNISMYLISNPTAYAFAMAIDGFRQNTNEFPVILDKILLIIPSLIPSAGLWLGITRKR